ncbi:MAG: 4-alpha-glucanotransferase [Lachnospirales bacterium]
MKKSCGILLPISSLTSKYGIGSFSKEAYNFIDKLARANQKYWQILPLNPTSYGDSPYQAFSSFAGNPYFIDLDKLIEEDLLTLNDLQYLDFGSDKRNINYELLYKNRFICLKSAFKKWSEGHKVSEFHLKQEIIDYSFFMALKDYFHGKSWLEWPEDIKYRNKETIIHYENTLEEEINFYQFLQIKFNEQWQNLKNYSHSKGISIIGDIPIYVALDSTECWVNKELFEFNEKSEPTFVAGCPPDGFSADGQLWGNPLYNWKYHEETNYSWWISRMKYTFELYDIVRVDHFRGFDEYYKIPFGDINAKNGHWAKGPGIKLFKAIKEELGNLKIIAEDLGFLTPSVIELLRETGYPGMKVLQFAFDSREESDYLPHNYTANSVVYTGTHDNNTILGWYNDLNETDKAYAIKYLYENVNKTDKVNFDFISLAYSSISHLAIIPLQDILGSDSSGRINTPSTLGFNWQWRILENEFNDQLINEINILTKKYNR